MHLHSVQNILTFQAGFKFLRLFTHLYHMKYFLFSFVLIHLLQRPEVGYNPDAVNKKAAE